MTQTERVSRTQRERERDRVRETDEVKSAREAGHEERGEEECPYPLRGAGKRSRAHRPAAGRSLGRTHHRQGGPAWHGRSCHPAGAPGTP